MAIVVENQMNVSTTKADIMERVYRYVDRYRIGTQRQGEISCVASAGWVLVRLNNQISIAGLELKLP